jgi:hypothetical protein
MKLRHSLSIIAAVASLASAQLPKAGTLILSADGSIGIPFSGVVAEENDYAEKIKFDVIDENGNVLETSTPEYNHFNWSGEMSVDVFLGNRVSLGLNGGYFGIEQRVIAQENNLKESTGRLQGVAAGNLTLGVIVPVEDNMYVGFKLYGGYAMGELTRVPTLVNMTFSDTPEGQYAESYYKDSLNTPIDVSGPTGAFEVKFHMFQSYGLMGSIGIRYGISMLSGTAPKKSQYPAVAPTYEGEESWINHSISLTASVGFGFKMTPRLNKYN